MQHVILTRGGGNVSVLHACKSQALFGGLKMRELSFDEINEVSGGVLAVSSAFGHLSRAFAVGWTIGEGINYLMENSYGGRGQFSSGARAGHE